jgi:1,4-alpha-glucan branching enzyme
MAEIGALPARGPLRRALDWLTRPASVRLSPLASGLATAALVLAIVWAPTGQEAADVPEADPVVYVQFVLEAPSASSVAVAGDFTDWEPAFALQDPDGDGVWSGRVPVRPGVHAYMFLVDETSWQTDPNAGRYQDDGFGNRNAVLAVGASS